MCAAKNFQNKADYNEMKENLFISSFLKNLLLKLLNEIIEVQILNINMWVSFNWSLFFRL